MGWEYADLFNNTMTGDGSFLEEPCFIPVGKMGYRRRTTVSGPRIDAEVFPVFGRHQRGEMRRAKGQITREAQQRANDERSRRHLIQLVEANFSEKDVAITLSYDGKAPDPERVVKFPRTRGFSSPSKSAQGYAPASPCHRSKTHTLQNNQPQYLDKRHRIKKPKYHLP